MCIFAPDRLSSKGPLDDLHFRLKGCRNLIDHLPLRIPCCCSPASLVLTPQLVSLVDLQIHELVANFLILLRRRFLLTPRIAEVMITRMTGCLSFDDSLWHREKKIVDVILEDDFDQKVKDQN